MALTLYDAVADDLTTVDFSAPEPIRVLVAAAAMRLTQNAPTIFKLWATKSFPNYRSMEVAKGFELTYTGLEDVHHVVEVQRGEVLICVDGVPFVQPHIPKG